jgi:hypothetical protein
MPDLGFWRRAVSRRGSSGNQRRLAPIFEGGEDLFFVFLIIIFLDFFLRRGSEDLNAYAINIILSNLIRKLSFNRKN